MNNAAQLLIATTNPDKAGEVSRILAATLEEELHRVTILNLTNLPWQDPPEEDGGSYEANARIKARAAVRRLPTAACLADDSGIEVAAFGGRPGIHSARWGAEEKGQRLSALYPERILRSECYKRAGQFHGHATKRNLPLLKRFQQRAHDFRLRPVELVKKQYVGEDGPLLCNCLISFVYICVAYYVSR